MLNQIPTAWIGLAVASVYLMAAGTIKAGAGKIVPTPKGDRFATLDGLRGFLAIFVLSHHSLYWYEKLATGAWTMPSVLFENLGKSSVCMFFMISSFLFYRKVLAAEAAPINWQRFAISRLLRLTPLYLVAMVLLFLEVAIASDWQINESPRLLISSALKWIGFTIFGSPDINHIKDTNLMIAGVTWSLTYEWLFYVSLPLTALASGRRIPWMVVSISTFVTLIVYRATHPAPMICLAFMGGIAAAIIMRWGRINAVLRSAWLSPILIFTLYRAWTLHYRPWNPETLILLAFIFIAIAAGNSLFGLLTAETPRKVGEVSYGIYLFHGLFLFAAFQLSPIADWAAHATPSLFLLTILAITSLIVALSSICFYFIETPVMALVNPISNQLSHWKMKNHQAWSEWVRNSTRGIARHDSDFR